MGGVGGREREYFLFYDTGVNRYMETKNIKILLIEDNPADARLITEMIWDTDAHTFEVKQVDRLSAGLELLSGEEFDVILLDLSLPDSRGMNTFDKIETGFTDIPVVILTGLKDEDLAVTAVSKGAQDYLVKGEVNSTLLRRSIHYAIERKKLMVELKKAHEKVKILSGIIPICASCKKIRDDKGYWNQVADYIREHSEAEFTHGFCPECADNIYGKYLRKKDK